MSDVKVINGILERDQSIVNRLITCASVGTLALMVVKVDNKHRLEFMISDGKRTAKDLSNRFLVELTSAYPEIKQVFSRHKLGLMGINREVAQLVLVFSHQGQLSVKPLQVSLSQSCFGPKLLLDGQKMLVSLSYPLCHLCLLASVRIYLRFQLVNFILQQKAVLLIDFYLQLKQVLYLVKL